MGNPRRDLGGLIFGLLILSVGLYYVLVNTLGFKLPELDWDLIWPLFVVALGVGILWRATTRGGTGPG